MKQFVALLMWTLVIAVQSAVAKPNIILIMADDSAADNYGCYGSTFFKTPILDKLAADGAKFNHCYSEPLCTPSRVKIMTGRDNIRNYDSFATLHKDEITFGTMMKNAGYTTAIAGKWQLHGGKNGSLAPACGFDTHALWNYPGAKGSRFWKPAIVQDGKTLETTEEDYGPDIFTNYIIDFIGKNKNRPFFVYYPMVLVHSPFDPTPDSGSRDGMEKDVAKLENFRDMTAYADKCVGRIIDALDNNGLRKNTVVIYTTDNGTHTSLNYPYKNEQRDGEKGYATDGGTHAPLIVNCPGTVPKGIVCNDMVDFSDVMPTIADITGAALPKVQLDGRSFWPQCLGKKGDPRKWIFQYYYAKIKPAADKHGQGINSLEIVWAQNQQYKLYRDGTLYATADRHENKPIVLGKGGERADTARRILQEALDSMPQKATRLSVKEKGAKKGKTVKTKKDKKKK